MLRFRLLSFTVFLLTLTFTVRLGDLAWQLVRGEEPTIVASEAMANEEGGEAKAEEKKPEEKKEDKKGGKEEAAPERGEIPAPKKKDKKETEVKGLEPDPFASPYSDEEVKVLQSLSKRREQLDTRAQDLDQREKLLQAAEKKVDEKVAELNKLKSEIENLLDKQTKMQDERIKQLVKIYENMKPKDAANIFNEMDFPVLLGIIDKMSERKVAPVLAAMNPDRARQISAQLAEQRALPPKAPEASDGGQQ